MSAIQRVISSYVYLDLILLLFCRFKSSNSNTNGAFQTFSSIALRCNNRLKATPLCLDQVNGDCNTILHRCTTSTSRTSNSHWNIWANQQQQNVTPLMVKERNLQYLSSSLCCHELVLSWNQWVDICLNSEKLAYRPLYIPMLRASETLRLRPHTLWVSKKLRLHRPTA